MIRNVKSRICTMADCKSAAYIKKAIALGEDPERKHRKIWEYYAMVEALEQAECLSFGKKGLGFAVGEEPLSSYFARNGCRITASDLTSDPHERWTKDHQVAFSIDNLNRRGICDEELFRKLVEFRNVDMNNIPEDLLKGEYDFIWSSCAMEHLGSIEKGLRFAEISLGALKPGGIAIHTTEYNCHSDSETIEEEDLCFLRKSDFEELARRVESSGSARMAPIDYSPGTEKEDFLIDKEPYRQDLHLKLELGGHVATSCLIVLEKL